MPRWSTMLHWGLIYSRILHLLGLCAELSFRRKSLKMVKDCQVGNPIVGRAKVTAIEESKDLSSLALDKLIGNLKVHESLMEKDSKIYKGNKERVKSIALKAKNESSDDETLTSGSNHVKRRSLFGNGMIRKERVIGNDLDAVIQIISLAIVQSLHETKIKRHFVEYLNTYGGWIRLGFLEREIGGWMNT
ncbi:hypothetical protein Tco_0742769 [Tanacetum coccineum]